MGSSPHSRGTLDFSNMGNNDYGIIPALAGNTRWKAEYITLKKDHPRTRGEHYR